MENYSDDTTKPNIRYVNSILKIYSRKKIVSSLIPFGSKLLEIGYGYGHFLRSVEDLYETIGIERSQKRYKIAKNTIKSSNILLGDALEFLAERNEERFHAVIAFDVLEHIEKDNLIKLIEEIHNCLEKFGLFIFSVPNVNSWGKRIKKKNWFGFKDPTHISLFSFKTWIELVEQKFNLIFLGGDGLWDIPYIPLIPRPLQIPILITQLIAATNRLCFPTYFSENLYFILKKR